MVFEIKTEVYQKSYGKTMEIGWLAVILCILCLGITGCRTQTQQETEAGIVSTENAAFEPTMLTAIDYTWEQEQAICSFEVLEEEQRILLNAPEYHVLGEDKTSGSDEDSVKIDVEHKTHIYEWDIQNQSMTEVDCGEYVMQTALFDGRRIFFMRDLEEGILYEGTIDGTRLAEVSKMRIADPNIVIMECLDVSDGRILFCGCTKDGVSYYAGKLKEDIITDIVPLEGVAQGETLGTAFFAGEGTSVFAEKFTSDISDTDLAGETELLGADCRSILVDELIEVEEYFGLLPVISTNVFADKIYYLRNGNAIYEGSLAAFINAGMAAASTNTVNVSYGEDKSCDLYDVGDFQFKRRSKGNIAKKQGVYYEIFVRAFADSDGDGIGDFNGITENLDYLQELGIDGIWLMPVNASNTYHGYSVTDYLSVNAEYGTEEDFKKLMEEAHRRGLKVIIDFVINHTSSEHTWFTSALEDETSPYRDYYRWVHKDDMTDYNKNDRSDWGSKVWHKSGDYYYYGMFGADMPDLNYNNPKVREEIKSAAKKWLTLGVDGFRLDAAMHIYGANEFKQEESPMESTITWWNEFALACEAINPDVYLVGEAWRDDEVLEEYVQPFDTKFNFAFQKKLIHAVCGKAAVTENGEALSAYLQNIYDQYDMVDTDYLDGIFGSNHDQERIMSIVEDEKQARQVAAVYMTLPGNPFIYYGEELGMMGEKPDEMIRTPFLWGKGNNYHTSWIKDAQNAEIPALEEQLLDKDSMYHFYKNMIALRKLHPALMQGKYEAADLGNDGIMAYMRETNDEKVLVIHNFLESNQSLDVSGFLAQEIVFSTKSERKLGKLEESRIEISCSESMILLLK